jgi:succinoglycan biosynthesis transport protein ExoP
VWAYIQTNLELKVEPARHQAAWFDEQIKGLRRAVAEAQRKLSDYQQQTGIIAVDERLDVENARLAELSSQVVAAQTQTYDSMTRQRQIAGASVKGRLDELPEILANSLIQSLKAELARAEGRLAEVSGRMDRNHPQYQSAQAEVQSLRQKISAELQTARGAIISSATQAQQREEELRKALAEQKTRVLELKQHRDRIALLTREVESAQRTYDSAIQRGDQIRMESQRNQTEIAVLNPAVPPIKHSKPRLLLNIALAIFMGTLLGVGFAFVMEMLDRRIRSEDDIVDGLGMPVLALITDMPMGHPPGLIRRKLLTSN